MKTRNYIAVGATGLALTFLSYGCNKPEPVPEPVTQVEVAPVKSAAEIAIEKRIAQRALWQTELKDLKEQYTHVVAPGENLWKITGMYTDKPVTAEMVDRVAQANGLEYLTLDPGILYEGSYSRPSNLFTRVMKDGRDVNANNPKPEMVLDLTPLSDRYGELEGLLE